MASSKRAFRSEASLAFERDARAAVEPFLRSRGFRIDPMQRQWATPGQPQVIEARSPAGESMRIRVRLCWRRDGRNDREDLYSAAQLAAKTRDGGWGATMDYLAERDARKGITHTLFLQRDERAEVFAALVPSEAIAPIWWRQYEVSDVLIRADKLGGQHKNHATNGHSPTIWLQDDRQPEAHQVADVLWQWPGVVDLVSMAPAQGVQGAKYWRVRDAVEALGRPVSVAEVTAWLQEHLPGADYSDTRYNLAHLTVNDANRCHYDKSRASFRSDQGHPRDALFRSGQGPDTRYERYVPERHGVFDILKDAEGRYRAVAVESGAVAGAYAQAESAVESEQVPLQPGEDGRVRELRAVVLRRGQPMFRERLLHAYGGRCAVTGCGLAEVLEAAHIVPYRGEHTQRVDNGLLLRADIHTLFDLGRLWIDENLKVRLSPTLLQSDYATLEGTALLMPASTEDRPHPDHLLSHRQVTAGLGGLHHAEYCPAEGVLDSRHGDGFLGT